MSTNVYKRFDPRVMEREERIGINRGLPTMDKRKTSMNFTYNKNILSIQFKSVLLLTKTLSHSDIHIGQSCIG